MELLTRKDIEIWLRRLKKSKSSARKRSQARCSTKTARVRKVSPMPAKAKKKKLDACAKKVKARYKVWPSAYASGAVAKCRKVGAKNWGNKSGRKK